MLVNAEETTAAAWDAARADDLDSAWFPAAVAAVARHPHSDLQRAVQHSAARRHRASPGSTTPICTCGGARTLAALMAEGGDPLLDVVEGQRSGQAHGASFTLPAEAEEHRSQAREAVATLRSRCPRTSNATSSSTPATWCRTGRSRGAAPPTCSSSWSSRRSSAGIERPGHGHHRLGDADHRPGGHRRPARALGRTGAARRR